MARSFVPQMMEFFSHGQMFWVPLQHGCQVCMAHADHPDVSMGVFGVAGHFFCSMECHDQHECRRAAVVFSFVDGQFSEQACHGPSGSAHVRCPECDHRRNQR